MISNGTRDYLQITSQARRPSMMDGERHVMDVVVDAQGSPFVFLIVAVRVTTHERRAHALPRLPFVKRDERLDGLRS